MNISQTRASNGRAIEQLLKLREKVHTAPREELAGIVNAVWQYTNAVQTDLIEQEKKNGN